eukprot:1856805-Prymnesium_polylepis.1
MCCRGSRDLHPACLSVASVGVGVGRCVVTCVCPASIGWSWSHGGLRWSVGCALDSIGQSTSDHCGVDVWPRTHASTPSID